MAGREIATASYYDDLWCWRRMFAPKDKGGEEVHGYRLAPWSFPVYLVYALDEAVQMVL
jgi:hypothetical protein